MRQWVTTHIASTEHDISSGLRDNFNPRKQWATAIFKIRAAGRLNAGALVASRRRDSEASATTSATTYSSGGWKDIAGEESDSDETEDHHHHSHSTPGSTIPSPEATLSPTAGGGNLERQEEIHPSKSEAESLEKHAKEGAENQPPEQSQPQPQAPSIDTSIPPSISVISPTPATATSSEQPRPEPHRHTSMPGSFNGDDETTEEVEDTGTGTGKSAETGPPSSADEESWGIAARMKKLVMG